MKTIDSDNENNLNSNTCIDTEEITDLLIGNSKGGHNLITCNPDLVESYNVLKSSPMGHKGRFYQRVLSRNNGQESRSQSMPNSLDNHVCGSNLDVTDSCDIKSKLLSEHDSPPHSPSHELWFNTWPERCEKIKSDNGTTNNHSNTQIASNTCDKVVDIGNVNNKITFSEALQNISLAYSPITKQLHLLPQSEDVNNKINCNNKSEINSDPEKSNTCCVEEYDCKKSGHRRTDAGSFSSTISSLSDPSPSGSLLDADERSSTVSEDADYRFTRKGFSNFFSR